MPVADLGANFEFPEVDTSARHKVDPNDPPEVANFINVLNDWEVTRRTKQQELANEPNEGKRLEIVRALQRWGDGALQRLIDAGIASCQAQPGHKLTENTLAFLANKCFEEDQMEDAFRISMALLKNKGSYSENPAMARLCGRAAAEIGNYNDAIVYLNVAKAKGETDKIAEAIIAAGEKGAEPLRREYAIRQQEALTDDLPRVRIETSRGDFVVELFENEFPNSVASFISLCERRYYEERPFYWVRRGYFALAGDKTGTGKGDVGYNILKEYQPITSPKLDLSRDDSQDNRRLAMRGSLVLIQTGDHTVSSKFGICLRSTTAGALGEVGMTIGRVVEGLEIITKLQERDPRVFTAGGFPPEKILRCVVVRKRPHEYRPIFARVHVEQLCNEAYEYSKKLDDPAMPDEQRQELHAEVMKRCAVALTIHPGHMRSHLVLAITAIKFEEYDTAIESLEKICKMKPDKKEEPLFNSAHEYLASAYIGKGDPQKAIETYRLLVKINPKHVAAYNNLGTLLMQDKKPLEAREAFERALKVDPTYEPARRNLQIIRQRARQATQPASVGVQ